MSRNTSSYQSDERRRRAREMMEEDASPVLPSGSRARLIPKPAASPTRRRAPVAPSTPPRLPHSPGTSSPKLAIKFAGKVYRTLDMQMEGVSYSPGGDFFGEPDEEVGEVEREQREQRRREVELDMRRQGGKRVKRGTSGIDDDLFVQAPRGVASTSKLSTPTKARVPPRSYEPPRAPAAILAGQRASPPPLGLPFLPRSNVLLSSSPSIPTTPLPPPLADLLALHTALESVLLFHLANEGSRVASSTSSTNAAGEATIRLPNLIDLPDLSRKIESSGRRFNEKEFARLVWVWEGCGVGEGEEEEELEIRSEGAAKDAGGMGFIVSRTRCGTANAVVSTYGIGISVTVKTNPQLPKYELVGPPSSPSRSPEKKVAPPSPNSLGRGREGMSVVALWSQGNDLRREEFGRRLKEWARRCAEDENDVVSASNLPPRKRPNHMISSPAFVLPDIPRATLPSLSPSVPSVAGTSSPSPKKKVPSDVFGPGIAIADPNGTLAMLVEGQKALPTGGVVKDRKQAMLERIQAKEDARMSTYQKSLSALSEGGSSGKKSLKPDKDIGTTWRIEQMERFKRNSMLSRLGNVADGVWMLFDVGRRKSILLLDVATAIAKSSKISLSVDEAQASLNLLCTLCPDFTYVKLVDRQEWLCMKGVIGLKEVKETVRVERERASQL